MLSNGWTTPGLSSRVAAIHGAGVNRGWPACGRAFTGSDVADRGLGIGGGCDDHDGDFPRRMVNAARSRRSTTACSPTWWLVMRNAHDAWPHVSSTRSPESSDGSYDDGGVSALVTGPRGAACPN